MKYIITYYIIIISCYLWTIVQILSGDPFDALILFIVTFYLNTYRNAVLDKAIDNLND